MAGPGRQEICPIRRKNLSAAAPVVSVTDDVALRVMYKGVT